MLFCYRVHVSALRTCQGTWYHKQWTLLAMLSRYPSQQLGLISKVLIISITIVCSSYVIRFIRLVYDRLADPVCWEKHLKDNQHNSLQLTLKICLDICLWTPSVPCCSQFSWSLAHGKLSAPWNRWCPRTNTWAYFCWKLKENCVLMY